MFKLHKPGQNQCDDRASVLIVSLGLLTALTLMAITFVTLQRIESLAARNFSERSKAGQLNKGILNYSINWLRFGTPGGTPQDGFTDEFGRSWTALGNGPWQLGAANNAYSASPEIYSWPRFSGMAGSDVFSFYDFIHVDELPVDAGVSQRVVSEVQILDCSAQIFIGRDASGGGPPANLQRVLNALMIYINAFNGSGDTDFTVADPYVSSTDTDAKRIADNLPIQSKESLAQLFLPTGSAQANLDARDSKFSQIRDFLAVNAVAEALEKDEDTDGDGDIDGKDDNPQYKARTVNMDFQDAPRALVNVNTASQGVLVALLDPVMILPSTADQTAERILATQIRMARPFSRWSDFVDFIRSDTTSPFSNSVHLSGSIPSLDTFMISSYGDNNSNGVNDWLEEREVILERFLPNIAVGVSMTSPMPRVGREADGYDNDGDGVIDEFGERNGVDDDGDGVTDEGPSADLVDNDGDNTVDDPDEFIASTAARDGIDNDSDGAIDEEDELDAEIHLEDMKTAEFTLVSAGIFELVITTNIYVNDGQNVDGNDNDSDGITDEDDESRMISSFGSRTIAKVFDVWRESTQEEFDRGTQTNVQSYPEAASLDSSSNTGWLTLAPQNLPANGNNVFYVPFTEDFGADNSASSSSSDMAGIQNGMFRVLSTEPNLDDPNTTSADPVNPNRPGNLRVDGFNFLRETTGTYNSTDCYLAYDTANFGGSANNRGLATVSMWVKLPFKTANDDLATTSVNEGTGGIHYLFHLPFANITGYDNDNYDNDGDTLYFNSTELAAIGESTTIDEANEYAQYISLYISNGTLIYVVAAAVDELTLSSDPNARDLDDNAASATPRPGGGSSNPRAWDFRDGVDNDNGPTPDNNLATEKDTDTDGELRIFKINLANTGVTGPQVVPFHTADISGWEIGEWHYVAITWKFSTGEMKLYVDGTDKSDAIDLPPAGWTVPDFNGGSPRGVLDHFYIGSPLDGAVLPASDNFPGPSNVHIDEFRIRFNSFDDATATDPGNSRYYAAGAASFISGEFPDRNSTDSTPPEFSTTRLIPYGTQLGTIAWTEFMPSETTRTADVTAIVQLDERQTAIGTPFNATQSSATYGTNSTGPGDLGVGAQILAGGAAIVAGKPSSGSPHGARLRYQLTFMRGEMTTVGLLKTPVIQDVTITLLTPVQIISSVEVSESD